MKTIYAIPRGHSAILLTYLFPNKIASIDKSPPSYNRHSVPIAGPMQISLQMFCLSAVSSTVLTRHRRVDWAMMLVYERNMEISLDKVLWQSKMDKLQYPLSVGDITDIKLISVEDYRCISVSLGLVLRWLRKHYLMICITVETT